MIDPTGHAYQYISDSEYNTQMNNLVSQKAKAESAINSYSAMVSEYTMQIQKYAAKNDYVSQLITRECMSMFKNAQSGLSKSMAKRDKLEDDIDLLNKRRAESKKVDEANRVGYSTEREAVEDWYRTAMPLSQQEGIEKSVIIMALPAYVVDQNGEIGIGTRYYLSKTYSGNDHYVGTEAVLANVGLNGIHHSFAHTHPTVAGYDQARFSIQDEWFAKADWLFQVDNMYMANQDTTSIYVCDDNGIAIDQHGKYQVVGSY
jgi:hypothetical protein